MRSIRSFLNLDTPALAKIWHLHHQAYRSKSDCTVVAWDHAVLAKPFFRNEQLLMAEDSLEGIVGFAHWGTNPEAQRVGKGVGILHRLCVRPGEDEDAIASDLIEASLQAMTLEGQKRCVGIGAFDDSIYYIGVAEGDGFLGVHSSDARLLRWMQAGGFRPEQATECWELALSNFKPPMDRTQISVHRNSIVSRILGDGHGGWWQSVVFGHCDLSTYQLVSKTKPMVELRLTLWTPEVFVPGVESWIARLSLSSVGSDLANDDLRIEQWIYLISECLRLLQAERKQTVQVVIDPNIPQHVQILQRLGFKTKHHGMVMSRELSHFEGR